MTLKLLSSTSTSSPVQVSSMYELLAVPAPDALALGETRMTKTIETIDEEFGDHHE